MSPANRRRHARVKPQQVTARIRSAGGLHIGLGIENISVGPHSSHVDSEASGASVRDAVPEDGDVMLAPSRMMKMWAVAIRLLMVESAM